MTGIGPVSGLGSTAATAPENNNNTRALCLSVPYWLGGMTDACRRVYATTAADAYDQVMYGGSAPPPFRPSAGMTPEEIAIRQRQIIEAAEAEGYHPGYSSLPGLTATEIDQDIDNVTSGLQVGASYLPYILLGGAALLIFVLGRPRY